MGFIRKLISFIRKNPIGFLILLYLIIRFPNLTLIPIFNDEAIYLDWGWRMTHVPGHLYYSLYDAKQPFIMWMFGISSSIFTDPLFAGRFISLLLGLLSTIGIYLIGREIFNKATGIIASITYSIIPIIVLFDRQALLESAIITTSIWGFYFVKRSLAKERIIKFEILAGIALGLGFLSKTTAVLYLLSAILIFGVRYFVSKNPSYLQRLFLILIIFIATVSLLLINPQFWQTLPSNSRYVLTLSDLFGLPINIWVTNAIAILTVGLLFFSPLIFIASLIQFFKLSYKKSHLDLIIWISVPFLITILTLKSPNQRYIVSLLPLLTLMFASLFIELKQNFIRNTFLTISIIFALTVSLFQIYKPLEYFKFSNNLTTLSDYIFVSGQTSGYGFDEVIEFLEDENKNNSIVVTYAENAGNPESGLSVYLNKKKIMNGYLEARYLEGLPAETQCIQLQSGQSMYFVSRDEQLVGLEKFVEKVKTVKKPLSSDTYGIYIFKRGCEKAITVNPVFNN